MEKENGSDVWYIPQGVSLDIIKSILGHCYNSQKRNQSITRESITKTIVIGEKTVGYALKMLENMGILTLNKENDTYSLNEISMNFAGKFSTGEDVTNEINQIIENSFLGKMLEIIVSNQTITKSQLVSKILLNSAAGLVKNNAPYMTTIYCILEILNLSGKIPKEKYLELRGNPEQTEKRTAPSTKPPSLKKRGKSVIDDTDTPLQSGIVGKVITPSFVVNIRSVEDIQYGRMALDKLEKELSNSKSNKDTTFDTQTTSQP